MNEVPAKDVPIPLSTWIILGVLGFISGCVVGQIIDVSYPMNGALHYHNPTWEIKSLGIEICWWIPILYGIAGVILVVSHPMLDRWTGQKPRGGFNPGWGFTVLCMVLFAVQFFLGPYLFKAGLNNFWLFIFTVGTGLSVWWVFDRTRGGLFMCGLTAVLGPIIEITMINALDLYHYTDPDVFGLPLWILGAYICGVPANANLGRKYFYYLTRKGDSR